MRNVPEKLTLLIKKECRMLLKGGMTSPTEADYIFAENLMLMGAEIALRGKLEKEKISKKELYLK